MSIKPHKDWKKLGTRTIEVMLYGSGGTKKKNIRRIVYSEKTLTPRYRTYWVELKKDHWVNTSLTGIKTGIVAHPYEFKGLRVKL